MCAQGAFSSVCGSHFLQSDHKASPLLSTSATVFYGMASPDVCQVFVSPQTPLTLWLSPLSLAAFKTHFNPPWSSISLSEENSFVSLDHSGIVGTEFVRILEETEFTILIDAYPPPKVSWLKDGKAITVNYYIVTKTSKIEGNR